MQWVSASTCISFHSLCCASSYHLPARSYSPELCVQSLNSVFLSGKQKLQINTNLSDFDLLDYYLEYWFQWQIVLIACLLSFSLGLNFPNCSMHFFKTLPSFHYSHPYIEWKFEGWNWNKWTDASAGVGVRWGNGIIGIIQECLRQPELLSKTRTKL